MLRWLQHQLQTLQVYRRGRIVRVTQEHKSVKAATTQVQPGHVWLQSVAATGLQVGAGSSTPGWLREPAFPDRGVSCKQPATAQLWLLSPSYVHVCVQSTSFAQYVLYVRGNGFFVEKELIEHYTMAKYDSASIKKYINFKAAMKAYI